MPIHPELASALRHGLGGALGWGAAGAGLGALGAEKGHRGEGALMGGLAGALVGGATHGALGAESARAAASAAEHRAERAQARARYETHEKARYDEEKAYEAEMAGRAARARREYAAYTHANKRQWTDPRAQARGHFDADTAARHWADERAQARARYEADAATGARRDARSTWYNTQSYTPPHGTSTAPLSTHAPWMAGVTTKADAKAAFRAQARANHPDVGGSTAKMQEINQQWDAVQGHPDYQKLAFCYDHGRRAALARFGA